MKKQLLVISVAAAIAAPAAMADVTAYGRIHVSGDSLSRTGTGATGKETKSNLPDMSSARSSNLGLKGSIDSNIPDAKVVFQGEVGIDGNSTDTVSNNPYTSTTSQTSKAGVVWMRDVFAGISSSAFGTIRGGIMTHSYKETHAAMDPLMTTALEARGNLNLLSGMSNGYGADKGSMVGSVRYDSPTFAGAKVIFQAGKDTTAMNWVLGLRYAMGPVAVSVDHFNDGDVKSATTNTSGTATMIAGKFSMAGASVGVAYEMDGGAISGQTTKKSGTKELGYTNNIMYVNADYTMGNFKVVGSYGMKFDSEYAADSTVNKKDGSASWRLAAVFAAAKGTDVYVGYGSRSANDTAVGYSINSNGGSQTVQKNSVMTVGMSVKF